MIEDALFHILKTDSGVSALVVNATSPLSYRIFPLVIEQHAYGEASKQPCIVYTLDGVDRQVKYTGTDDVSRARFQIDSYARTWDQARELAAAVLARLLDFTGAAAGIEVKSATIENEFTLTDPEPGLFRVTQFWNVWF